MEATITLFSYKNPRVYPEDLMQSFIKNDTLRKD